MNIIYYFTLTILFFDPCLAWRSYGRNRDSTSGRWNNRRRNRNRNSYYRYRYGSSSSTETLDTTEPSNKPQKMNVTGYIYADNWFRFYVNDELIVTDPIEFRPHNGIYVKFEVNKDEKNVYAFEARDFGVETTGLEYEHRCIGDGGLRAIFDNGLVTNNEWQCVTTFKGPLNPEGCFNGTDSGMNEQRFQGGVCKEWNYYTDAASEENCQVEFTYYGNKWFKVDYDDSSWLNAYEYEDQEVGFGTPPNQAYCSRWGLNFGEPLCLSPRDFNWGNSTFIWTDDLNFNNRILCRYTQE